MLNSRPALTGALVLVAFFASPTQSPGNDLASALDSSGVMPNRVRTTVAHALSAGVAPSNPRGENALTVADLDHNICCGLEAAPCSNTPGLYNTADTLALNTYWDEELPDPIPNPWVVNWTAGINPGSLIVLVDDLPVDFGDLAAQGFEPGDDVSFCATVLLTLPPQAEGRSGIAHGFAVDTPGGSIFPLLVNSFDVNPGRGEIVGTTFETILDPQGVDVGLQPLPGVPIRLRRSGQLLDAAVSDGTGDYQFQDLPQGRYDVIAQAPDGRTTVGNAEVADLQTTRVQFFVAPQTATGIFAGLAGVPIDSFNLAMSPDVNENGVIDIDDLGLVRASVGGDASDFELDLTGDGLIDDQDIALVEGVFGRSTIELSAGYQVLVDAGDGVANIGAGAAIVTSLDGGMTTGETEPTGNPDVVRLRVTEDVGSATVRPIGSFDYNGIPGNPSFFEFDVNTGLLVNTNLALQLSGGMLPQPVDLVGAGNSGFIALRGGGLSAYRAGGLNGQVPSDFPDYGNQPYTMGCGSDDPKKDVACASRAVAAGDQGQNRAGLTRNCTVAQGGSFCTAAGAACATGGKCKTCVTRAEPAPRAPTFKCTCKCTG